MAPRPPSQPYWPTGAAGWSRRVTTPTQNPHPRAAKSSGKSPDTAFWSGVRWSAVIVSTVGRLSSGEPPHRCSSARAGNSPVVDTSPAPPEGKDGGALHWPPGSSKRWRAPDPGSVV